ncbi:MAG: hypothetical protein LBB93_06435, partial [Elusimicrobiota bacterium]|nr:hypothetical protein [Elusimicrobiota bacterium]
NRLFLFSAYYLHYLICLRATKIQTFFYNQRNVHFFYRFRWVCALKIEVAELIYQNVNWYSQRNVHFF